MHACVHKRGLAGSHYLTSFTIDIMTLGIDRTKYVLRICSSDAKTIVEEEIKRIESGIIAFRRQTKKRFSDLTDQYTQHRLAKFKCAREILRNRTRDHNKILDEWLVSSLLFYKNHRCLSRKVQHCVKSHNTQLMLQQDSAAFSGFELSV